MTRIALFLGAGASAPYGLPTTKGLAAALPVDFPRPDLVGGKFPDIEHVLLILDQTIRFANTEAGRHCSDMYSNFKEMAENSRRARKIVERLVWSKYDGAPLDDSAVAKTLTPLFELAKSGGGDITIFTTNYDTVIETYCEKAERGIDRIDGFRRDTASHLDVWRGDFAPNEGGQPTRAFLYKLHGSISWQRCRVGGKTAIVQKPGRSRPNRPSSNMYIRPSLRIKKGDMKPEPYATIMGEFERRLPSFDACVAIGCSFRDAHIRGRLVEFMRGGKILVAVSPTAAADFWSAMKAPPAPGQRAAMGSTPLCGMSYGPGGKDVFYAVHKELGDGNAMDLAKLVRDIIDGRCSAHRIGSIAEAP